MVILDTNVVSEILKPDPNQQVASWLLSVPDEALFTTAVTVAELYGGVYRLPEGRRRSRLEALITGIVAEDFRGRIADFDQASAKIYGYIVGEALRSGVQLSTEDGMIAAIALRHDALLATRDRTLLSMNGLRSINPWSG